MCEYVVNSGSSCTESPEPLDGSASLYSIHWLDRVIFVFSLIVLLAVIFGNSLILLSMRKIMVMHVPTNMLIVNMSLSDMSVGLFVMPFSMISLIQLRENNVLASETVLCNIIGVMRQTSLCSSTYTVAVISYERYIAVHKPISYKRIVNKKFATIAIICVWSYAISYALITVIMPDNYGAYTYNDYTGYCIPQWSFNQEGEAGEITEMVMNALLNFITPFSLMVFYYSKVLTALHANMIFCRKWRVPSSFRGKFLRTKRDREINSAWTILIIFIAFVVCWLPFLIQSALSLALSFRMSDQLQLYFVTFANLFYFLGCGINPLIYIFRCERFRKEATRLMFIFLSKVACCNKEVQERLKVKGKLIAEV